MRRKVIFGIGEIDLETFKEMKKEKEKTECERIAKLIRGIEDRLAAGVLSEETYGRLRKKYEGCPVDLLLER